MFCTDKEKETCNVEKMGCKGCHYFYDENKIETSMKQLEIHIANHLNDEQWNNWQEVLKYIKELSESNKELDKECSRLEQKEVEMEKELQLKDKVIKEAIEKCKTEIKILEELADEEYQTYGRSSEYELYSEQLDTLIDIKEKLENK